MNWWRTDVTRHQQRWVSSLDTLAEESHERGSDGRARGHGARSRRLQRTRRGRPPARARGSGRLLRRLDSRPQAGARRVGDGLTRVRRRRRGRQRRVLRRPACRYRAVAWTVNDSSVARIEGAFGQTAVIRAVGTGSALVTATSEGKSGSGSILVP